MPIVMSTSCASGDEHRRRELPLEPERDVADDQQQRHDDREDCAPCDLASEARRDVLHPERLGLHGVREVRLEPLHLTRRQRLGANREAAVRVSAGRGAAALDLRARLADPCRLVAHLVERDRRAASRTRSGVPPSKSIPRFRPLTAIAPMRDHDDPGDREPRVPAADEVELQPARDPPPAVPITRGLSKQLHAREEGEERPRREDGRQQRDAGAEEQHEREAAHAGVATANSTSAVIAVTTFASTMVAKPFV